MMTKLSFHKITRAVLLLLALCLTVAVNTTVTVNTAEAKGVNKKKRSQHSVIVIARNTTVTTTTTTSISTFSTSTISATTTGTAQFGMVLSSLPPALRAPIPEPLIRVGLYKTAEPVEVSSTFSYQIMSGQEEKGLLTDGKLATLSYDAGVYRLESEELNFTSSQPLRLIPFDRHNYFTILNHERTVGGRGGINFNSYRGTLEYRYSVKSDLPFVINELPLDEYISGVAETDNNAPPEYIRALVIAERSYALVHIASTTVKHPFDVYATTVDQLYLGYKSEQMMPKVAELVATTTGYIVTYHSQPALTPYFGHSDGHTRDGKKNYGGHKPWLVSVKTIHDQGKRLWGHGVGMSCADAAAHAFKDGWTAEQILKYYYTGVAIEKFY